MASLSLSLNITFILLNNKWPTSVSSLRRWVPFESQVDLLSLHYLHGVLMVGLLPTHPKVLHILIISNNGQLLVVLNKAGSIYLIIIQLRNNLIILYIRLELSSVHLTLLGTLYIFILLPTMGLEPILIVWLELCMLERLIYHNHALSIKPAPCQAGNIIIQIGWVTITLHFWFSNPYHLLAILYFNMLLNALLMT